MKMIKKMVTGILVCGILLTGTLSVGAASSHEVPSPGITQSTNSVRKTQYQVRYRAVNGVTQYRIWNCTYGHWEGDWTDL